MWPFSKEKGTKEKANLHNVLQLCYEGEKLDQLGKFEDAIACFDKALAINPNYGVTLYDKGLSLINLGRDKDAIACFEKALTTSPRYADAWCNKGVALARLGTHSEAIVCFDKALEINHSYAEAWYNKALSLGDIGKSPKEAFQNFIRFAPPRYAKEIKRVKLFLKD